jgi:membrane protein required for colicin V production
MNLLDWIFIIIISVSSIYGLFKGLIREVILILAVMISLIATGRFYGKFSPLLIDFGLNDYVSNILSFFILFFIIFIVVILIGKLIHWFIQATFLGWINRLGGIGFGFIRGVIISSIIIIILTIALSEKNLILCQSKLTPYIMGISKVLLSLVPEDLKNRFMEQEKKLSEFWEKNSNSEQI